ncbi:MAG TPA: hypothetical protein VGC17_02280 [Lactovum miscens]
MNEATDELAGLLAGVTILSSVIFVLIYFGPQLQTLWNSFIQSSRPNF